MDIYEEMGSFESDQKDTIKYYTPSPEKKVIKGKFQ
jgi:hypothetical protein